MKTSILFLDKTIAKKTDKILFVKVEADGFDLGAQRRPNGKDDLPAALDVLRDWRGQTLKVSGEKTLKVLETFRVSPEDEFDASSYPLPALLVPKAILAESDYNLSGDRYRQTTRVFNRQYSLVALSEVCEIISGQSPPGEYYNENGDGLPFYQGKTEFTEKYLGEPRKWTTQITKIAEKNDILMSVRAPVGPVNFATQKICIGRGLAAIRPDSSRLLVEYLFSNLRAMEADITGDSGAVFASISRDGIGKIQIPLPPLDVQKQIVEEIEGYQRIIDGARQVVDGWKPNLELELDEARKSAGVDEWESYSLDEIASLKYGFTTSAEEAGDARFIRITDINEDGTLDPATAKFVTITDENKDYLLEEGDLLTNGASYQRENSAMLIW